MNKEEEKTCRFGHMCTSGCQNDFDCPCQSEHCCAFTEDCDGTCDDCFNKICPICKDKGYIEKTEWADDDKSYDVTATCICREDND